MRWKNEAMAGSRSVRRIAMRVKFSSTWYDGKLRPVESVYLRRESLGRGRLLLTYSAWMGGVSRSEREVRQLK